MAPKYAADPTLRRYQKEKEREKVLELWNGGEKSYAQVAALVGKSKATVQSIVGRFGGTGSTVAKKSTGRPLLGTKRYFVLILVRILYLLCHFKALEVIEKYCLGTPILGRRADCQGVVRQTMGCYTGKAQGAVLRV